MNLNVKNISPEFYSPRDCLCYKLMFYGSQYFPRTYIQYIVEVFTFTDRVKPLSRKVISTLRLWLSFFIFPKFMLNQNNDILFNISINSFLPIMVNSSILGNLHGGTYTDRFWIRVGIECYLGGYFENLLRLPIKSRGFQHYLGQTIPSTCKHKKSFELSTRILHISANY